MRKEVKIRPLSLPFNGLDVALYPELVEGLFDKLRASCWAGHRANSLTAALDTQYLVVQFLQPLNHRKVSGNRPGNLI